MPLKLQRITNVDVFYQEKYPDNYDGVIGGAAYWYPHPLEIIDYEGKFAVLEYHIPAEGGLPAQWLYHYEDLNHPRCPSCKKFVKKGNWWKGIYSGPCSECYEFIANGY